MTASVVPALVAGEGSCRPTRRRGAGLEAAIQRSVIDLLATVGYEALTMEQIAAAAGTGKATLYRRWATKSELVLDALDQFADLDWPLPDTGSLREDLVTALLLVVESMEDPVARGAAAALSELAATAPSRRTDLRRRMLAERRNALLTLMRRAAQRGEITAVPGEMTAEAGMALLIYRLLTDGLPIGKEWVQAAVDEVLLPLCGLIASGAAD